MAHFSGSPRIAYAGRWMLAPTLIAAALAFSTAAAAQSARNLRALHDFEASGPVRLAPDQVARVCATNYGNDTDTVLLVLVDATPDSNSAGILASEQAQLPPRTTACLDVSGANLPLVKNVVGLVVDNGFVNQGVIQQGIGTGGGGCIASLQILDASNKATVVVQMASHHLQGR